MIIKAIALYKECDRASKQKKETKMIKYPLILSYVNDRIPELVESVTNGLIADNSQLSKVEAMNLAAQEISRILGIEHEEIENQVREESISGTLSSELEVLYDNFIEKLEKITYRQLLINTTGTRTILT